MGVPAPKAEPKGKATPVPEAKSAQAPKAEPKEMSRADPKVEVKKEKGSGDDAPGDSRGSAEKQKRERKSCWDPEVPAKESTKREASTRPDDVDRGAAAREASGDDLHSALGRSSAKDAVAPLTASKAMAKRPEGSEVRLRLAERAAASPVEGNFRTLPEGLMLDAFLAMCRVLNRQVRDFIRNGEEGLALETLSQIVANPHVERARRGTDVSRTPSRRSVRTQDTRDSRDSTRRRYRPRRDDDRDRRRDDRRDHRGDESLDRDRDRRRDDRRRSERDRDRDRARGGRGLRPFSVRW